MDAAGGVESDGELGARAALLPRRLRAGVAASWVERVAKPHATGALAAAWPVFRAAADAVWTWAAGLPPRSRTNDVAADWAAACEELPSLPPCAAAMAAAIELARAPLDREEERAATLLTTVLSLCRATLEEAAPWVGPVRWEVGTDADGAMRLVAVPEAARAAERRRNALRFDEVRVEFAYQECVTRTAEGLAAKGATSIAREQLLDPCAAGPARYLRLRTRRTRPANTATEVEQLPLL